jgi:addiction module HigA family antidote
MTRRKEIILGVPTKRRPTTPGEMLVEEFLKPLSLTQTAFARRIGVTHARLNEIINGRRGITVDTALRFSKALGTSPEWWLTMQHMVDLYDAMRSKRAEDIDKIEPIEGLRSAS